MNNHNDDVQMTSTEDEEHLHAGVDLRLPHDIQSMIENSRAVSGTDLVVSTPRTDYSVFLGKLKHIICRITVDHSQSCTCVYSCSARMDRMVSLPLRT